MSSPDPTQTYEDNILDHYTGDELSTLWELYVEECKRLGVKADLSQFPVWLEDRL